MIRNTSKRFLSIFVRGSPSSHWKGPVLPRLNHAMVQPKMQQIAHPVTQAVSERAPRRALVVFDMKDWEGSMLAYRAVVRDARPGDHVEIIYRHRDIDACEMDSLIRNALQNETILPTRIVPALHCNTPRQIIEYASEIGACTVSIRSECAIEFSQASMEYNINLISAKKQSKPYSFYVDEPKTWVTQKSFI